MVAGGERRSREARDGKMSLVRKVVVEKGSVKEVMEEVDISSPGALVDISSPGALVDNSGQGSLVDISGHEALVEAVRRHGEKVDTLRRRGRVR